MNYKKDFKINYRINHKMDYKIYYRNYLKLDKKIKNFLSSSNIYNIETWQVV